MSRARELPQVPVAAAQARVRGLDGSELELAALWAERPAVLVFLRHFGCMFCREQAVRLQRAFAGSEAERAGARLVFIGNGSRRFARAFREDHHLGEPIYVDTERISYAAFGFERGGVTSMLSPRTWKNASRALRGGFRQGLVRGDPWQLGGVLVVLPGGRIAYRHASAGPGDHPPEQEVLEAASGTRQVDAEPPQRLVPARQTRTIHEEDPADTS